MKICKKCTLEKPLTAFDVSSRFKDGYGFVCKACKADQKRVARRAYYESNKDKEREQNRTWHRKNKPWNDPGRKEYHNSWRRTHDRRAETQARRAKLSAGGSFTTQEWIDLCNIYKNVCLACGSNEKLSIDHVVPISAGGLNVIQNIQPLCMPCNTKKGTQTIDYRS